jgi:hypothetical protein
MDLRDYPQRGISKIPSFVLIMVGVAGVVTRGALTGTWRFSAALQPTKRMCFAAENAEGRRT